MNRSYNGEVTPLISTSGIPATTPDRRQPREKQLAVYANLASTLFERIAFYTVVANLSAKLETSTFKGDDNNGTTTAFIFSGTSYISTILFAIISDAKLGRARTVVVGFFVYLIGYILAIVINVPDIYSTICLQSNGTNPLHLYTSFDNSCSAWILVTLIIIAIGSGSVQSNMTILGVEQISDAKLSAHYFDKYAIAVNIGGIIASMTFVYMSDLANSNHNTYLYPCILAASALFVSALIFLLSLKYCIHATPYESVITKFIPVIINAFQARHRYYRENSESMNLLVIPRESSYLNASHRSYEDDRPRNFLDFAKLPHGQFIDRVVDDVKSLCRAIIVFLLLIPYFLIYNQLTSTFSPQAKAMLGANEYTIKLMWLGDPATIILGVLLLNTCIHKCLKKRHISVSLTTRLVIGMCFATLSMFAAATVEYFRQDNCINDSDMSNLSIYWQLPQNILMGLSEIFAIIPSFEYAYFASPRSGQTLFMSLRFCSVGISSFLGYGYMAAIAAPTSSLNFFCSQKQNPRWEFYTYFLGLAGIQLIFIVIFILCQKKFHIIKYNRQRTATNEFFRRSTSLTLRRPS